MEEIYFKYREWVYTIAWRMCGNREDALEVLQEVFAYFFGKFPTFKLRSQIRTFLYPVVKNTSLNLIRKRRRVVPLDDAYLEGIPDESYNAGKELDKLNEMLKGLSSEERELAFLRFYDGFSLTEIAEILKIPIGTVKSRLHRTLSHLRNLLRNN